MSDSRASSAAAHLPLDSAESGTAKAGIETNEAAPSVLSAGSLLKQARENAGLHIATLAVLLKVPVKKLEALEADRFDLLPDAVFARALASSVCRHLKMDSAAVLEKLPHTGSSTLAQQSRGINTPFRGSGDSTGPSRWIQVSRPAVLAGLVLLLGTLVLVLLPALNAGMDTKSVDPVSGAINEQPSISSAIGRVAASVSAAISEPRLAASRELPSSPDVISLAPLPGSSSSAASSLPPPVAAPVPVSASIQAFSVPASAPSAVLAATMDVVMFTARSASWVQVSDAKGVVVLRRTLAPGEVVGATGALPLSAIVGRADAIQVQVRGNAFDLAAVAKNNVARFEVN